MRRLNGKTPHRAARTADDQPPSVSPNALQSTATRWKSVTLPEVAADNPARGEEKTTEIAAVRLLSRREHSTRELKRKLQHKGHSAERVERVVDKLAAKKLVSDERFAANFVAYRARRGQGPIRIRAELRQQGTTDDAIDTALSQAEVDWDAIACAVRRRKFGAIPRVAAERAKQSRFLQYRGFSTDQIRVALSQGTDSGLDEPSLADIEPDWPAPEMPE